MMTFGPFQLLELPHAAPHSWTSLAVYSVVRRAAVPQHCEAIGVGGKRISATASYQPPCMRAPCRSRRQR